MNLQKECLIKFLEPDFEFADDRGKLTQLFREGWSQVNVITSKAGSVRGDHYHKNNHELFYVISGEFILSVSHLQEGVTEKFALKPEMMFVIPPKILHSFTFESDVLLLSAYDRGVEEGSQMDIYLERDRI